MKLALKYKPRPKITEGFIPRRLDTRVDARLSALLEEREAEGVLPGHFSRRMRRHRGRLIQTVTLENSLRPVSQPAPADMTVSPAPVKAPPTTKMPAAEPSVRATEPPVLRVTTVPLIKLKQLQRPLLPQQRPLPVSLQQLQAGQNRSWRSSPQSRGRTCCRPA